MKLQPKNGASADDTAPDAVHMPWEAALAGLASGAYDVAGYPAEATHDVVSVEDGAATDKAVDKPAGKAKA